MALATSPAVAGAVVQPENGLSPSERRHLSALERKIENGLLVFREVGEALLEIRDKRLYRLTHITFEAYCRERWGMERTRAYQIMGAAEVAKVLPHGKGPMNEVQARELVPLLHSAPDLVPKAWAAVEAQGKPITAPLVRDVIKQMVGDLDGNGRDHATPITPTAKLLQTLRRVEDAFMAWEDTKPSRAERKQVAEVVRNLLEVLKV